MRAPPNKGMHQPKGARSGRFAADHLEAPFAGDARVFCGLSLVQSVKHSQPGTMRPNDRSSLRQPGRRRCTSCL